jgi:DNA-binding transcriptional ArsR family regulator
MFFHPKLFTTSLRWLRRRYHVERQSKNTLLTCNQLVAYYARMDEVFKALADASRRSLLDRLHVQNGQTLNDLCDGLAMTRQAVTKHLAILEAANLVTTYRQGREKLHYLNPLPIHQIGERWIKKFERGKLTALSELKRQLEKRDD